MHARLPLSQAPGGLYRDVLDFLGCQGWHAATRACLVLLLALPVLWFLHADAWLFRAFHGMGLKALRFTDVQAALDGVAVAYQHDLLAGVPLLFCVHILSRHGLKGRFLPWLLVPVFLLGTAVGSVVLMVLARFGD